MNTPTIRDPKRLLLDYLKRTGAQTTRAVAGELQVSEVAARQHLMELERRGLVTSSDAAAEGKGRPPVLWRLTSLAHDTFPDRHDALTLDLIDSIRSALGEDGLDRVISARTRRQLASLQARIRPEMPLPERLETLAEIRTLEGYMAEVKPGNQGDWLLLEHHCPICDAAQSCQAFCSTELELFQAALGSDVAVVREQHLLSGDERCVYRVTPLSAQ